MLAKEEVQGRWPLPHNPPLPPPTQPPPPPNFYCEQITSLVLEFILCFLANPHPSSW